MMTSSTVPNKNNPAMSPATGPFKSPAQEVAAGAMEKAKELGGRAVRTADAAAASVGAKLHSVADTVKQNTPSKGALGVASTGVANTLDQAGRYLEQQGISGIAEDLTATIRKHPVPALLMGLGFGVLLARLMRR